MGKKKKSYEEVFELFKERGYELLDKIYINKDSVLNCLDSCGYNLRISYNNLKKGNIPSRFHKNNPHTIENIKLYIKLNRENVELVSTEYIKNSSQLIFKCLIHNEEFPITWSDFQQGHGCQICSGKQKISIPIIKQRIIDMGRDKEVELVSTEYFGTHELLMFKCLIHNEEFPQQWTSFQSGCGCPICGIEKNSGENNYMWKGGISPLHNHLRGVIFAWKNASFGKYNGKCDITGIRLDTNIIHHLHPFSSILKETMETLNLPILRQVKQYSEQELKNIEDKCLELHYIYGLGVCLTREIHDEFHKIYGKMNGKNTKEQYEEFKTNKLQQLNKQKELELCENIA